MSSLPDSRPLALISIPGTHESLALHGGVEWQCQSMSLDYQLSIGIRALDIRCQHSGNRFLIHHSFVYQKMDFDDVLTICSHFLRANPSETILMRVKKEWLSEFNTETFEQTFARVYLTKYRNLIWQPQSEIDIATLTLGQVRGKVVILQNFDSSKLKHYGPQFKHTALQDDYILLTIWALYPKWLKVKAHLYAANSSLDLLLSDSTSPFFINFLSGSVGVKPYFVASGHSAWGTNSPRQYLGLINEAAKESALKYADFPRDKCLLGGPYCMVYFTGTNMLTLDRLQTEHFRFVGIVYSDFPGCGLVQAIIDVNKQF